MKLNYYQVIFTTETSATSDYNQTFESKRKAFAYLKDVTSKIADNHKSFSAKVYFCVTNNLDEDDLEDLNVDINDISSYIRIGDDSLEQFIEVEEFSQNKYMNDWKKTHMARVNASYNTEFVNEFKVACKNLGVSQSQVFREAMQNTIDKAESRKDK